MKQKSWISSQLLVTLGVFFILNSTAHGKKSRLTELSFKPHYKAEKCDCIGYSDDIPTFLSDLAGGSIDIFGEGESQAAAEKEARNMCKESYRNFARVSVSIDNYDVTESGCQFFKTTQNGDWVSL